MKHFSLIRVAALNSALFLIGAAFDSSAMPSVAVLGAGGQNFQGPARVATDAAGKLYVADAPAGRVVVMDAFGRMESEKTGLASPLGIAADTAGNIYLGEEETGSVSVFDPDWNLLQQLGAGSNEFRLPGFIALDETGGGVTVLVSDSVANEIKTYRNGALTGRFGTRGTGSGQFNYPAGLWLSPAGELFVVDQNNDRIQVFDRSHNFLRAFSLKPPGMRGRSGRAQGLAGDAAGRLYVADTFQGYVTVFDTNGTFLSILSGYGTGAGRLRSPAGLAVDTQGRLFVASLNNSRVEGFGLECFTALTATPASQFAAEGSAVTFSASPSCGGVITYQWRKAGVDLIDGGRVAGATNATLTLTGVTLADAGLYTVQITVDGQPSISPSAILAVLSRPVITSSPTPQSVPLGGSASLHVTATGDELDYRWYFNGLPLEVPSRDTLEISNASLGTDGNYWVVVSNAAGAVTSAVARVNVLLPPAIVQQPADATVAERGSATLSVSASGSAPLTYAWLFNGSPVTGASAATLSLTNVIPPQAGAYQAVVANGAGAVTSQVAVVSVVPDTVAPQLLGANGGQATNLTITLSFTERLDTTSAQNLANYSLTGSGGLSILAATVSQGTNVVLTLSGPRTPNANYAIQVANVTDTAYTPNVISPNPSAVALTSQIELVGMYTTVWRYLEPTNNVLDAQPWKTADFDDSSWLTGRGIFYGNRTNSVFQPNPNPNVRLPLVINTADPSNYLANTILNVFTNAGNAVRTLTYYFRTEFYFPADTNGATLRFRTAVDDGGVYWLNGQEIRRERMPSGTVSYSTLASGDGKQEWAPKPTDAPRVLGVTGLQTGTNILAVEVHQRLTNDTDVTLGVWLEATVASFAEGPVVFRTQPQGGTINEGQNFTFNAVIGGALPRSYQWYKDGAPIPGATNAFHSVTLANVTHQGDYHVVATNPEGSVESAHAALAVIADTVPPQVLTANGGWPTNAMILVSFSERLDMVSAQNPANYTLTGPGDLTVLTAVLGQNTNVMLTLSGARTNKAGYTLTVHDVRDAAYTPNLISPNPSTVPVSSSLELLSINGTVWKYFETTNGAGLDGQPWMQPGFDDSAWASGSGIFFGHRSNSVDQPNPNPSVVLPLVLNSGDSNNTKALTILNVFTNASDNIREITYYFRAAFDFPADTNGASLWIYTMLDDGAVVYLNGQEAERVRMAAAPAAITAGTLASALGGQTWEPALAGVGRVLALNGLQTGANILAVELHQQALTSSDVTLGLLLQGRALNFVSSPAPALSITPIDRASAGSEGGGPGAGSAPVGTHLISWNAPGWVLESAPSLNGPWTVVANASPYEVVVSAEPARFFRLRKAD